MSQPKTQILITDIPKDKFTGKWPEQIEKKLFSATFPQYKAKLEYFTPLAFLNRIVIILNDEQSANDIYNFLIPIISQEEGIKVFLTESLLLPRSRSFDDTENQLSVLNKAPNNNNVGQTRRGSISEMFLDSGKPILSLDTNPLRTGVDVSSLSVGSPSLSPDKCNLNTPTLLKFDAESKPYYYSEPLPKSFSQSNLTVLSNSSSISPISSTIQDPETVFAFKPKGLKIDTSSNNDTVESEGSTQGDVPSSPLITINQIAQ